MAAFITQRCSISTPSISALVEVLGSSEKACAGQRILTLATPPLDPRVSRAEKARVPAKSTNFTLTISHKHCSLSLGLIQCALAAREHTGA